MVEANHLSVFATFADTSNGAARLRFLSSFAFAFLFLYCLAYFAACAQCTRCRRSDQCHRRYCTCKAKFLVDIVRHPVLDVALMQLSRPATSQILPLMRSRMLPSAPSASVLRNCQSSRERTNWPLEAFLVMFLRLAFVIYFDIRLSCLPWTLAPFFLSLKSHCYFFNFFFKVALNSCE